MGYHAVRMARLTPTHKIYATEGRGGAHKIILRNALRNNPNNLELAASSADIGEGWKLTEALEHELMGQKKTPCRDDQSWL